MMIINSFEDSRQIHRDWRMSKEIAKMLQKNSCVAPCAPSPVAVAPAVVVGRRWIPPTKHTTSANKESNLRPGVDDES